jgi:hypothetical protein
MQERRGEGEISKEVEASGISQEGYTGTGRALVHKLGGFPLRRSRLVRADAAVHAALSCYFITLPQHDIHISLRRRARRQKKKTKKGTRFSLTRCFFNFLENTTKSGWLTFLQPQLTSASSPGGSAQARRA